MNLFLRGLLPLVAAGPLVLGGCGRSSGPSPNLVLVTLDTTRADRLGVYGRPDARTPVIDAWARAGAIAETAIADVPLTLPSHVSLFTATPALYHGVRTNADRRLGTAAPTLAERFAERGYATAAIVSTVLLAAETGVAQGFAHYDDRLSEVDRRADEALDRALEQLDELAAGSAPFFLWIHLYDPHLPYDAPAPWDLAETSPYLAEIAFADRELARLARELEARGLTENTIVCVMSDHGEGRGDHREDGHGIFLYDDTVRVPLLLAAPGRVPAGSVVSDLVRTVDVAPTLLELTGAAPAFGAGGSLGPALRGDGPVPGAVAYCETVKPRVAYSGAPLKALRTRDAKLIWAPRPELYDLRADPGETNDLAAHRGNEVEAMAEELEDVVLQMMRWRPDWAEDAAADPERLAALRSLGYSAGGGRDVAALTAPDEMDVSGVDPKDLVDVAMALEPGHGSAGWERVMALNLAGRAGDAEREAARMLAEDPEAWRVRLHRGMALALLGRTDEAKGELAAVAADCPEGETRREAAHFGDELGTEDEESTLDAYRRSWLRSPQSVSARNPR